MLPHTVAYYRILSHTVTHCCVPVAVLSTWSSGASTWEHPCWLQTTEGDHARATAARKRLASAPPTTGGLAALRSCVEVERARAPPSESTLARLRRLAAAHDDYGD